MISNLFLGFSLLGADWVLYILILLSILSVTLLIERAGFYRKANKGINEFRSQLRDAVSAGEWDRALQIAKSRELESKKGTPDLESAMSVALLNHKKQSGKNTPDILTEVASDHVIRNRIYWEKNLSILATIGNNAPFIGLFGTVLGIIKAFHDLSTQAAGAGASGVTAGISEALIATAVGILVAIPAVVGFNLFQRKNKAALQEAEALKSFLVGHISR